MSVYALDIFFHFLFDSPLYQGIVTSFVLQAHPQGEVWVGIHFLFATLRSQVT